MGPASKKTHTSDDSFLLLPEVAQIARAPLASVRYWVQTGKLRALRPGKRVLVLRSDLEKFLTAGER